ncbi:MAG: metallophosphoesterase family protein [Candidatus Deferrimicrobium sp.]
MKVGILSDTHDHRGAAEGALLLFRAEGVGMVFHLGDVYSPAVLAGYGDPAIPLPGAE